MKNINILKSRYNKAKSTKVGETVNCPWCGKKFEKTTYHKTFCSNYKTRGRHNCKDNFWNKVDPEKRCRNTPYFHNVILENHAKERGFPSHADMVETELMDDPSWDAHGGIEIAICDCCNLRADYCRCGVDVID
jgi:ssDNA-binding Zn-finger/Zn-ribbon topoisomerase 1